MTTEPLPGNPYAFAPGLAMTPDNSRTVASALLALAYEQRTANLIAAGVSEGVAERLGRATRERAPIPPPPRGGVWRRVMVEGPNDLRHLSAQKGDVLVDAENCLAVCDEDGRWVATRLGAAGVAPDWTRDSIAYPAAVFLQPQVRQEEA